MKLKRLLDETDLEFNPEAAPQTECECCGNEIYPEYYKNELGDEFNISDIQ